MDDGPYWVILLMYGSHDMRHTGFRRLTVVNGTLGLWQHRGVKEATWEREDTVCANYPFLFEGEGAFSSH